MNIAENILKHSLQNVYFLYGTAMAGKTTMAQALVQKHGFVHFTDNWHDASFDLWLSLCDPYYQPESTKRNALTDWEAHFSRTVEEFLAEDNLNSYNGEYLEFALIELVKLSQRGKVVTDLHMPVQLLLQLTDRSRIVALLLDPTLATCRAYGSREDHREYLECILSLKDPEKKLAVQDEIFKHGAVKGAKEAREHGLFCVERNAGSTVEGHLAEIEKHFRL